MTTITLDAVRAALALPLFDAARAHARMAPGSRDLFPGPSPRARHAGVLVLLYPQAGDWHIVLTRRTDHLRGHSGQVSFPGGRRDPSDGSLAATALRETCEELGVCQADITVIGGLTPIYIPPSDYHVHPTVGAIRQLPALRPNPDEVAEVFSITLAALLDERVKAEEYRDFRGVRVKIPYYAVAGHKVWGATAIMLSELEQRLRVALAQPQRWVNPGS